MKELQLNQLGGENLKKHDLEQSFVNSIRNKKTEKKPINIKTISTKLGL